MTTGCHARRPYCKMDGCLADHSIHSLPPVLTPLNLSFLFSPVQALLATKNYSLCLTSTVISSSNSHSLSLSIQFFQFLYPSFSYSPFHLNLSFCVKAQNNSSLFTNLSKFIANTVKPPIFPNADNLIKTIQLTIS